MATQIPYFSLDPGASRSFAIDWADILTSEPDDTALIAVAWTVAPGLVVDELHTGVQGTMGVVRLSAAADATLGETYAALGVATFADGQVDPRRIYLTIQEH